MENPFLLYLVIIIFPLFLLKYAKRSKKRKVSYSVNLPLENISTNDEEELEFEYKRKQYLLNKSEYNFFNILNQITDGQMYIFPQVHLSELFEHKIYGQNWRGALNHIQRKSVDFVICDKQYLKPLCAIELDGSSHNNPDREDRDRAVEKIFKIAKLPLIRIEKTEMWDKEKIKEQILKAIE